ncbi:MAG: hypothetical protein Kow0077_04250 [Anaerolineae bacterium]
MAVQTNQTDTLQADELALLHQKVDRLTALLEAQERRSREFDELKADVIPIMNHAIRLTIDELDEVGSEFKLEDLFYLGKRLLRDTQLLIRVFDQLEGAMELGSEAQVLSKQVFSTLVHKLDELEREGYFAFARSAWYIVEQIVREFSEEDVLALGDNIVIILRTVRNMTQPEIMALANNAISALNVEEVDEAETASTWAILRELRDPKLRKGMLRLLNIVKALAEQPDQIK